MTKDYVEYGTRPTEHEDRPHVECCVMFCCSSVGTWSKHMGPHTHRRTVTPGQAREQRGPWLRLDHLEAARFTEETGG